MLRQYEYHFSSLREPEYLFVSLFEASIESGESDTFGKKKGADFDAEQSHHLILSINHFLVSVYLVTSLVHVPSPVFGMKSM